MRKKVNWKEAFEALQTGAEVYSPGEKYPFPLRRGYYVNGVTVGMILDNEPVFEIEVPDPPAPKAKTEIRPVYRGKRGEYWFNSPGGSRYDLAGVTDLVNWTGHYQHRLANGTLILSAHRVLATRGDNFVPVFHRHEIERTMNEGWRLTEIVGVEMIVEEEICENK